MSKTFADLIEETLPEKIKITNKVVAGRVIAIEKDYAVIDVGLKTEGRVLLQEFIDEDGEYNVNVDDIVEVYIDRVENNNNEAVLSRDKARREETWFELEKKFANNERVNGRITNRVKGGLTVNVNGVVAFLPGSQVDVRPIRDITPLLNQVQPFQILKMDRQRGNIVLSRRAVLEEKRAERLGELQEKLQEGQVLEGVVKNITDYGAFIDLGMLDGLLHVTDISWKRINHPSEVLSIGETVRVQITRFDNQNQRVSLGMKQLEADPWSIIDERYAVGMKIEGMVTNITDYGAFIELDKGIEGLVHVSEISWTKKNVHPGKIISTSEKVNVMILDIDKEKRRISLGIKQCSDNPWESFAINYPEGSICEGVIKNIADFGLFIGFDGDVDGMVHTSDISWNSNECVPANFNKGDVIRVKVLNIDTTKERIGLSIKQLSDNPVEGALKNLKKGQIVTCDITDIDEAGIHVKVGDVPGYITKANLSKEKSEQRPDRFATGEKVDAKIAVIDKNSGKLTLSIKSYELDVEKEAMSNYGSADSGASLGDILGVAMQKREDENK